MRAVHVLAAASFDVTDAPSVGPALLRFHRRIQLKKRKFWL